MVNLVSQEPPSSVLASQHEVREAICDYHKRQAWRECPELEALCTQAAARVLEEISSGHNQGVHSENLKERSITYVGVHVFRDLKFSDPSLLKKTLWSFFRDRDREGYPIKIRKEVYRMIATLICETIRDALRTSLVPNKTLVAEVDFERCWGHVEGVALRLLIGERYLDGDRFAIKWTVQGENDPIPSPKPVKISTYQWWA